jgi:hydroxymethylpyrimidine pyrophosphatase-like HAD family hydrolase
MEGSSSLLKMNEIRCPYCRKKQLGVLPYYEELIPEKTNGVNFYDYIQTSSTYINSQGIFSYGKCEFIVNTPTSISTITFSGHCSSTYVTKSECDNKTYCWSHNRTITKQFEKEKKEKEKEAQKQLKKEAKQKEKEDKKLLKKTKKQCKDLILSITNVEEENIIVSSSIQTINEGCIQIIKTGPNKGNFCGLVILNDCLCKRHYNLKNKVLL